MRRGTEFAVFAILAIVLVWLMFLTFRREDSKRSITVSPSPAAVIVLPSESPLISTPGGSTLDIVNPSPSSVTSSSSGVVKPSASVRGL